jgi:hypothetical protein
MLSKFVHSAKMSIMASQLATRSYVSNEKLVKFNWEDALDLEGKLDEEERMIRDTARAYA